MLPIRDHNPSGRFPLVTLILIVINILAFFVEISSPDIDAFIKSYAFIPRNFDLLDLTSYQVVLSSMFLHGGWIHLLSNMWFLWIFGDNVEARLGKIVYLLFYLFCGIIAVIAQYLTMTTSIVPVLGASGAIAGVLGAYHVFFPRARIETLLTLGWYISTIEVPASLMLGYWFLTQFFSGVASVTTWTAGKTGGIAFFAHLAGFVAGYLVAIFLGGSRKNAEW